MTNDDPDVAAARTHVFEAMKGGREDQIAAARQSFQQAIARANARRPDPTPPPSGPTPFVGSPTTEKVIKRVLPGVGAISKALGGD